MRAVKSVLVMAGALKRANPQLPEDVVLIRYVTTPFQQDFMAVCSWVLGCYGYTPSCEVCGKHLACSKVIDHPCWRSRPSSRAMRDSNLPKFLAHDVELFCNIIGDLFPGVHVPDQVGAGASTSGLVRPGQGAALWRCTCWGLDPGPSSRDCAPCLCPPQDHGELKTAVRGALAGAGLQQPAAFVSKVLQLYDTFNVRFGVMLVRHLGRLRTCHKTYNDRIVWGTCA